MDRLYMARKEDEPDGQRLTLAATISALDATLRGTPTTYQVFPNVSEYRVRRLRSSGSVDNLVAMTPDFGALKPNRYVLVELSRSDDVGVLETRRDSEIVAHLERLGYDIVKPKQQSLKIPS